MLDVLLRHGARERPKATVLYTSGVWVQGDTGGVPVDEATPLRPHPKVDCRPALERRVLTAGASKARRLLGCEPRHTGSTAEAATSLAAWGASREDGA